MVAEPADLLFIQEFRLAGAELRQQIVHPLGEFLVVSPLPHQDFVRPTLDLQQVLNLLLVYDLPIDNSCGFAGLDDLFASLALDSGLNLQGR